MNYLSNSQWCDWLLTQVLHGENSPRQPLITLQIKQLHFISSHSLFQRFPPQEAWAQTCL